eukprot:GHRR01000730.1.p1 GENE.GHRR01000730.1~~GHRR01000730.1.p1  ORF type:complete len:249 (+),score=79.29 GHRR01000730.1:182-928(+)
MADFFNQITGRHLTSVSAATLFKFTDLDPRVQKHLTKVYTTLTLALGLATLGVIADVLYHVGGALTTIAALVSLVWLGFTQPGYHNQGKRYALLGTFAFCQGTSIGPLVGLALAVNPGIILTAALSATAVFACFSLSALFTQRRSYLFLGSWLSSAVMGMMMMRFGGWMFGFGRFAFEAELYLGLLVFAGYVLFDTQLIVERASAGDMDHIKHALDLFVDFISIAVRILIILLKNQEKQEKKERKRRD